MRGEPDPPAEGRLPFRSLPLPQREVALLIVLCLVSVIIFAATRRMAGWSRAKRAESAEAWFQRGEALAGSGDMEAGIAALREAVAQERRNPVYVLSLARRLEDASRHSEATQLLLRLRQDQPDDVEINYGLARLSARDDNVEAAVRYYNYAMYGLVRVGVDYDRRRIRTELIGFLLDQGQNQEAKAELQALDRELPDEAEAHMQAAVLASRAGDARLAFAHYARANVLVPDNAEAATGAGLAAYALHDYPAAVRELSRARDLGAPESKWSSPLEIARLVLATDPLASRVATALRTSRLRAGLTRAAARYDACLPGPAAVPPTTLDRTRTDLAQMTRTRSSAFQDPDLLAQGVAIIGALQDAVRTRCPSLIEPLDQAWVLIAERHSGGGQ